MTLEEFAAQWLKERLLAPPHKSVYNYGVVISSILYRDKQFQVELFLIPANTNIILNEHSHPNVDSYEVYQSGEIMFTLNSEQVVSNNDAKVINSNGTSKMFNTSIRVLPGIKHGATVGPDGGSFISIQHWIKGSPTSVGLDWEGIEGSNYQKAAPVCLR